LRDEFQFRRVESVFSPTLLWARGRYKCRATWDGVCASMNNSLLSLYDVTADTLRDGQAPFSALPTREGALRALNDNSNFDLLILGGGLTGALVAHQAALQDVRVLLIDSDWFGARSISWCHRIAKMLRAQPLEVLWNLRALRRVECNAALSHLTSKAQPDSQPLSPALNRAKGTPLNPRLHCSRKCSGATAAGGRAASGTDPDRGGW